jgi:hypothetical protein
MPREKETSLLKSSDYDISGNSLRAFYDKHGKLVFVLDLTTGELKPNVLLVMTSVGDRKWDDVLSNDYGMDLELVRPKKDNKYQKLDVEYDGLIVYDNLIRAYQDGGNVKSALKDLESFRATSVRRSATERLAASTVIAENARETIERTGDTIVELKAKIKAVKSKLVTLKRGIGREPTKQSAAKILKAEAQLDVLTGKLERAQKRLENANKRLLIAEDDMDAARKVLDLIPQTGDKKFKTVESPVAVPVKTSPVSAEDEESDGEEFDDEPEDEEWVDDEIDTDEKADDKEIKPLFDKDPNILDEGIAFKPISFNETPVEEPEEELESEPEESVAEESKKESDAPVTPAMSFEPPKSIMDVVQVPENYKEPDDIQLDDVFSESVTDEVKYDAETAPELETESAPMLNSLKSVDVATDNGLDTKMTEAIDERPVLDTQLMNSAEEVQPQPKADDVPYVPQYNVDTTVRPVAPAAPVAAPRAVTDVPQSETPNRKPSLLYYVLLLVLIALSVFTLWLYQRSNVSADAVPELVTESVQQAEFVEQQPAPTPAPTPTKIVDDPEPQGDPFVASGEQIQSEQKPVIQEITETSLNKVVQVAEDGVEPVKTESGDDIEPEPVIEPEPEPVVVNKPEYNVSQDDVFTTENKGNENNLCAGDVAPDENGCCPGETYSTVDGMQLCCPDDGGDCFPPMF